MQFSIRGAEEEILPRRPCCAGSVCDVPMLSEPKSPNIIKTEKIGFSAFSSNLDITSGPLHKLRLIRDFRTPKKGNQRILTSWLLTIFPNTYGDQKDDFFQHQQQISLTVDFVFQCNGLRPKQQIQSLKKFYQIYAFKLPFRSQFISSVASQTPLGK